MHCFKRLSQLGRYSYVLCAYHQLYRIVLNFEERNFRGFHGMDSNYKFMLAKYCCVHAYMHAYLKTCKIYFMKCSLSPIRKNLSRSNLVLYGMSILYTASVPCRVHTHPRYCVGSPIVVHRRASVSQLERLPFWVCVGLSETIETLSTSHVFEMMSCTPRNTRNARCTLRNIQGACMPLT